MSSSLTQRVAEHPIVVLIGLVLVLYGAGSLIVDGVNFWTYRYGTVSVKLANFESEGVQVYRNEGQVPVFIEEAVITYKDTIMGRTIVQEWVEPGSSFTRRPQGAVLLSVLEWLPDPVWGALFSLAATQIECVRWNYFSENSFTAKQFKSLDRPPNTISANLKLRFRAKGAEIKQEAQVLGVLTVQRVPNCQDIRDLLNQQLLDLK